jgi:hypothetical protein
MLCFLVKLASALVFPLLDPARHVGVDQSRAPLPARLRPRFSRGCPCPEVSSIVSTGMPAREEGAVAEALRE